MSLLTLEYSDITPFADLGTKVEEKGPEFLLTRNGNQISVRPADGGYSVVVAGGAARHYSGACAVLSDAIFADLPRIARNQAIQLGAQQIVGTPVPVVAKMRNVAGTAPNFPSDATPWRALDFWLRQQQQSQLANGTDLLLIDGPAGVGKTTIVRETALERARQYDGSNPLILQIASRGRVLQNISDLIAYTLQDVRSNITINQLLVLMRHGMLILAIDGFDELSDPNGFKTAWSGLNNLLGSARGLATFLLAGRETFVSTELMLQQLTSFDATRDRLVSLSISDPKASDARHWLLNQPGWSYKLLSSEFVEPIFVEGSYALRPFFLHLIAREPEALTSEAPPAPDLLSYLVETMTVREGKKFLELLDPPNAGDATLRYEAYIIRLLEELARDLAENQSEAISDDALDLIAAVAADGILPDDQIPAIVNRARTVVFLANDVRPGHIRFAHEQLQQHFLSREALRSVGDGETPRYVRRNLFGREALDVFAQVARGQLAQTERFLSAVRSLIIKPSRDRTNINLSVLGVAAACAVAPDDAALRINGVGINELHFPFAAPPGIVIRDTTVSVLHAVSADLSTVTFEEGVHIVTLEIDDQTRLSASMPMPQILVHHGRSISDQAEIKAILAQGEQTGLLDGYAWPQDLADLLGRIDRYRLFWIRTNIDETDPQGRRIIGHPRWPAVFDALRSLDLVVVKVRQASGMKSDFVHFRRDVRLIGCADLYRLLT